MYGRGTDFAFSLILLFILYTYLPSRTCNLQLLPIHKPVSRQGDTRTFLG